MKYMLAITIMLIGSYVVQAGNIVKSNCCNNAPQKMWVWLKTSDISYVQTVAVWDAQNKRWKFVFGAVSNARFLRCIDGTYEVGFLNADNSITWKTVDSSNCLPQFGAVYQNLGFNKRP